MSFSYAFKSNTISYQNHHISTATIIAYTYTTYTLNQPKTQNIVGILVDCVTSKQLIFHVINLRLIRLFLCTLYTATPQVNRQMNWESICQWICALTRNWHTKIDSSSFECSCHFFFLFAAVAAVVEWTAYVVFTLI